MQPDTDSSLDCRNCGAWARCAFRNLAREELEALFKSKAAHVYQKHEKIFSANTKPLGVYCIKRGLIKLTTDVPFNKQSEILYLAQPGELLGVEAIVRGEMYHDHAEAVEESELCQIDKELFISFLEKNPKFSYEMLSRSAERIKVLDSTIARLSHTSVRERIAQTLLFLTARYGQQTNSGAVVTLGLTRQEIAQLSGTVQESVVRVLSDFKDEGLIKLKKRDIAILNEPGLHRVFEPQYSA